ncbi:hypothetical protein [Compostimonas suwonensis]|uniref:Uncharacterized protein n=1 Tax=Compostimonas suwonensis TaxID=1048394 RepID=A0A2M9BWQ5_9MICO|nr:hypothetical protein [Compostimonas suwonensis]PJJ62382.1 hypothetical protein CLV54_2184 [Compostimonas suwonensis]
MKRTIRGTAGVLAGLALILATATATGAQASDNSIAEITPSQVTASTSPEQTLESTLIQLATTQDPAEAEAIWNGNEPATGYFADDGTLLSATLTPTPPVNALITWMLMPA